MGSCMGKSTARMVMVGLDGAGKTTVLYHMKLGEPMTTIPTIGFNVETIDYKKHKLTIWDVGGQDKVRSLWKDHYAHSKAVIFVVDSSDKDRIAGDSRSAAGELSTLLEEPELKGVPLLVLANKTDLPGGMAVQEVQDKLGLNSLQSRKWHIQGTVATTGAGLNEAFDWLVSNAV